MASWLPHTLARQKNASGRALEQDGDVVADLNGGWRQCGVAPVVGEADNTLGSFSKVGGCSRTCRGRKGEAFLVWRR
jgi:hypothetical protein